MDEGKDPQAAIHIVETHEYNVVLGIVPQISWQSGRGTIRLEVPYDGTLLNKDALVGTTYPVGEVEVRNPETEETDSFSIALPAGNSWQEYLKSARRIVKTAEYELTEPTDQLVSIDGDVLDDLLVEGSITDSDRIFGNIDTYQNPLALRFTLWVPDRLMPTQVDQNGQLEILVRQGENSRQILMPSLSRFSFEERLAENMAALANSAGGTILIGVEPSKQIVGLSPDFDTRQRLVTSVLNATLRCSPHIPLGPLTKLLHIPTGRHVYRIDIPQTNTRKHKIENILFTRRGSTNIKLTELDAEPTLLEETPSDNFNVDEVITRDEAGNISYENRKNVVILDGSQGLNNLEIGTYLCGLINANCQDGRIIITNLNKSSGGLIRSFFGSQKNLNAVLVEEMNKIMPPMPKLLIERQYIGNQSIAVISVPAFDIPVALYDGQAYIWQNAHLNDLSIEKLFETYLISTNKYGQVVAGQEVFLNQATMNSPISPPAVTENVARFNFLEGLTYDVEYQAKVWQPRPFDLDPDTVGHTLILTTPLRQVSLSLDDDENVTINNPEATGNFQVSFQDVLLSGREISPHGNDSNKWFNAIPIFKQTRIQFNYTAHLNELIRRRRKTSILRFLVPDVLLNLERVNDLAQVFADTGFRVYESGLIASDPGGPLKATIEGIRGEGYHDIGFRVGLLCEKTELTRELHYEGWHDSKATHSAMLDVRVKLWGIGEAVEQEIGRLQMDLYETISQRLQHLRTE